MMIPHALDHRAEQLRFLSDAESRGAALSHVEHPLTGPDGGALRTDVARFGAVPGEAATVVLVSSGLHGVEGHAGSGLQHLLVDSGRLERLAPEVAVVLVHAVNPFGHAWSRRVDHENIDVNRNFIDGERPDNPGYAALDAILNPVEFDPDDVSFLDELLAWWAEVGDTVAFSTISGGQYSHPRGVQFGGTHASWSRGALETIWSQQLVGATDAVALDIHTGLGPLGRQTVFQTADADEPGAVAGAEWFRDWIYRTDRSNPVDHGLLGPGFDAWSGESLRSNTFVLEFGTHDPTQGITVFRADNWLHHHGDPTSPLGERIRSQMRDFFFVEDEAWRTEVAEQGLDAIHRTLDGVERGDLGPA